MGTFIANCIADLLTEPTRVLVLGLTFKENVPDLRNSKVIDLIRQLETRGHTVDVHDAMAVPEEAVERYGVELLPDLSGNGYGALVGAVGHDAYTRFDHEAISRLVKKGGLVADIKGLWRDVEISDALRYWLL